MPYTIVTETTLTTTNQTYTSTPNYNFHSSSHKSAKIYIFHFSEMLTYIMSAFYAKMLIILGIALPITDAIATKDYENYDVSQTHPFHT